MNTYVEPKPRGRYVPRDGRYVAEYLTWAHPHDPKLMNVRLGPPPRDLQLAYPDLDVDRWARVWDKTCDAIAVTPGALVVIEGELRRPIVAIGELLVYRELIPQTQSLSRYWSLPIRSVLLTPLGDPTLEVVMRRLNIETVLYRPEWVEEYLRTVGRL